MPILQDSPYKRPWFYTSSHIETVYPSLTRVIELDYDLRERLELPDGDFLDLDWVRDHNDAASKPLVVMTHGLAGHTQRHYVKGTALYFKQQGWDALAWNCRSCSGEMNRLPRFYDHGNSDDLEHVVNHAIGQGYRSIALVGFSMGGSITVKYLGEKSQHLPKEVVSAACFSTPFDLAEASATLEKPTRSFYKNKFLKKLLKAVAEKNDLMPGVLNMSNLNKIKTLRDFDNQFTAPLNGLENAMDYYQKTCPLNFLPYIKIPFLACSADNDPFFGPRCYPYDIADGSSTFFLEVPKHGGHLGFVLQGDFHTYFEKRSFEFTNAHFKA